MLKALEYCQILNESKLIPSRNKLVTLKKNSTSEKKEHPHSTMDTGTQQNECAMIGSQPFCGIARGTIR